MNKYVLTQLISCIADSHIVELDISEDKYFLHLLNIIIMAAISPYYRKC